MAPGTWWRPAPLPFLVHMAVPLQGLLAGKPVGHTRPGHQGEGPEEVAALLSVQVGLLASPGRGPPPSVCPQASGARVHIEEGTREGRTLLPPRGLTLSRVPRGVSADLTRGRACGGPDPFSLCWGFL